MGARRTCLAVAAARAALGVVALAAPALVARPWVGEAPGPLGQQVLGRALGGRDLALGLGALLAGRQGGALRNWGEAGAFADAIDAAITVVAFRRLPAKGRWAVLASASGAALAGALSARCL